MHVALDTSALDPQFRAHAVRGTGRYVCELYERLPNLLFNQEGRLSSFRYSEIGQGGLCDRMINFLPAGRTTLRHQVLYPLSLKRENLGFPDLLHFPVHADAPTWSTVPFVVTVLDLIPLIFKELYAPKKNDLRFQFARWLELQSIRNARAILAISENTAKDVHEILGVPRERIHVTPLGVDISFFSAHEMRTNVCTKLGLQPEAPFILYVGGIDQRKNIVFLLEAFHEVIKECGSRQNKVPKLVMAGKIADDDQYPVVCAKMRELGIEDQVISPGYVPDSELKELYAECALFFYPSLYEGFGLPPLEAMAAGAPVVCSNTSSLPEVVGEDALLFSPTDRHQAVVQILRVLQDHELRCELKQRGIERAKGFTWDETAARTVEGYYHVLAK